MNLFPMILHIHSGLRWLVLAGLMLSIAIAVTRSRKSLGQHEVICCGMFRLTLIIVHLQFLFGLILYFMSPKVIFAVTSFKEPILRFFLVEHLLVMILAIALVTVGFIRYDRAEENRKKYRSIIVFYSIALVLILMAIPWPFLRYGGSWF